MAGNTNLELEIHSLFIAGSTPDQICGEILSKYSKTDILSPNEAESISHFFITLGRFDLLFSFYLSAIRRNALGIFPWGYLAWAAKEHYGEIPADVIDIIEFALPTQAADLSAHKFEELHDLIPHLDLQVKKTKQNYELEQLQLKAKLIAQLNHNRLYQLHEQEEQALKQLVKNFPNDMEVRLLHQAHLEKKADEILSRVRAQKKSKPRAPAKDIQNQDSVDFIAKLSDQIKSLAAHYQSAAPEQIYNLSLLCMSFELYDLGFQLLQQAPETFAGEWLKAEILFESGRFLDLLKHLEHIEATVSADPESTFGATYLKAQAYFGLGQKDIAIQMLESLSQRRPSYRSAESLLHQWRSF